MGIVAGESKTQTRAVVSLSIYIKLTLPMFSVLFIKQKSNKHAKSDPPIELGALEKYGNTLVERTALLLCPAS